MYDLLLAAALVSQGPGQPVGHLIIAGGGETVPEICGQALQLAGGKRARVLVIPHASEDNDSGPESQVMWRQAGAGQVAVLDLKDRGAALAAIRQADLIWMPGGDQTRLMQILRQQGLVEALRERFRRGATVGGTSAGAAVMSPAMLTEAAQLETVLADAAKMPEGLGLWPGVIVDQHLVRRCRFNRLLSAVLSQPGKVGIGIDECTAVVVSGRSFEVVGKSNVIVIDARGTVPITPKEGEPEAAANVSLHVLKAGMKFDLERGVLPEPILYSRGAAAAADRAPVTRTWTGLSTPR
jgi:cyanophycinase